MISMVIDESDEPIRTMLKSLYPQLSFGETAKCTIGEYQIKQPSEN